MNTFKVLGTLSLLLILGSCKSFKVLYNWSADDRESVEGKNILVVARTSDLEVRKAFEREITKTLNEAGMKATASFMKFPDYNPEKKYSDKEKGEIKKILDDNGYDAVVLTVLKDVQEETRSGS